MNRRPLGLSLAKAIPGFLHYKTAEALSPNTLISYQHDLKVWLAHAGDVPVTKITTAQLRDHFAWLRTEYKPRRFSREPASPLTQIHSQCLDYALGFFLLGVCRIQFRQPHEIGARASF